MTYEARIKELFPQANGTILFLSNGVKALVAVDRCFFCHGAEIKYSVAGEKNGYSVINISAINYAEAIEKLCVIKGYSLEEAKAVKSAYVNSKGYRKDFSERLKISEESKEGLLRFLFGYAFLKKGAEKVEKYGVTWKALEELFERFGFKTFIKLKESPYDCVGNHMSFVSSHRIFYEDDYNIALMKKLMAKKVIAMLKAEKHSYVGLNEIWRLAEKLEASPYSLVDAIPLVMKEENIADEKVLEEHHLFAFKEIAQAERELSALLKKVTEDRKYLVPVEKIEKFREKLIFEGVKLSTGQSAALDIARATGLFCLTGGPGTGKTTVVRNILRVIEENIPNTVVKLCAPTGKAAKRLSESTQREAVTVHRLLEMDHKGRCRRNEQKKIEADIIVVDEASMLDTLLTLKLLKAVPADCLIVLVGDVDQLPPVEAGQVFNDLIKTGGLPIYRLYETMRQKDGSVLLSNINKIRDYFTAMEEKPGEYETHEFESPSEVSQKVLVEAKRLYQEKGLMDFQLLVARHEGAMGTNLLNAQLQLLLNPNKAGTDAPFVKGDKIIFTKNNYKAGYLNGDLGIVVDNSNSGIEIQIVDGATIFVPVEEYKNLDLAYAITVHKSQGSEYPCVMVAFLDEDNIMLTRNWFYTAVSRAKQTCLVYKEKEVTPMGSSMRKTLLPLFL